LDSYGLLSRFLGDLLQKQGDVQGPYVDGQRIPYEMGLISDPNIDIAEYIDFKGGIDVFAQNMVRRLLVGYVPISLGTYHREEAEDDAATTRPLEMKLRDEHMQALILKLYKEKIEFIGNNTKDEKGFGQEVTMNPAAEPQFNVTDPGTVYATFTLAEKNRFDHVVFKYLFPDMNQGALERITRFLILMKEKSLGYIGEPQPVPQTFWRKLWQLPGLSWIKEIVVGTDVVAEGVMNFWPDIKALVDDLLKTHEKPSGDETFYQNLDKFEKHKDKIRKAEENPGLYPAFLGPNDVWNAQTAGELLKYSSNGRRVL
jgi:hypothetical protein